MTLLVLDADNLINRAFYAIPAMFSADGTPTNALRGFANTLLNLQEQITRTHGTPPEEIQIIAAFDRGVPAKRKEAAPSYKANRGEKPAELSTQLTSSRTLLCPLLGVNALHREATEADDLLYTMALRASEAGIRCFIASGDKDTAQCLSFPQVTLFQPPKKTADPWKEINPDGVKDVFGVEAHQIPDYLALMGDAVDNLPGVAGAGPKTAAKWIAEYGSLENLLTHASEVNPERLREKINPDQLRGNMIVTKSYDTGDTIPPKKAQSPQAVEVLKELGLHRVAARLAPPPAKTPEAQGTLF